MDEDKLAKLNEIQDFFNRVDRPSVESIGVKDFIEGSVRPRLT